MVVPYWFRENGAIGLSFGSKIVLRVHLGVAHELEHGSMEGVRARFGARVDLRDRTAELGAEDARLDLELLERIDRRQQHVAVEVEVGVLDAVERVVVVVDALAGDVQRKAVPLAAHALLSLCRRRTVRRGARNQRGQLQVVAAVQRQLDDAAVLDDRADRRVFRLDHRRVGDDRDDVGQLANLERERNSVGASDLDLDVRAFHGGKSVELGPQCIGAGRYGGEHVHPGFIGLRQARGLGVHVGQRDSDARHDGAAGINGSTGNFTRGGLGRWNGRKKQKKHK